MATKNTPPAGLTSGELFTALVLAMCPTAMGQALAITITKPSPTLDDWSKEIDNIGDTQEATTAMQSLLADPRYQDLFTRLLQNDSVGGTQINAANMVRDKVWRFSQASQSAILPRWESPPHPAGGDIVRIINQLKNFTETGGQTGAAA
jgi:hypothetical protein